MALSTIRKHQKKLLAVLAVLAMIAFSFDIVIQTFQPTPARYYRPVARVYGQEIYPDHVEQMRQERIIANQFMAMALTAVGDQLMLRFRPNYFGDTDLESILEAIALAYEADRLGIEYSDRVVTDFIVEVTNGRLTPEQFQRIVQRLRVSQFTVYAALKNQLRIRLVESLYFGGGRAGYTLVTPLDAWRVYRQVTERVTFDAIPVAVEDYVDQVDPPAESELRAYYERYKDRVPNPLDPEPGFRRPPRVHIQYAAINVQQLVEEMKKSITEEEIKQYYEENKELYRIDEPQEEDATGTEAQEEDSDAGQGTEQPKETQQGQQPEPAGDEAKENAAKSEESAKEEPSESSASEQPKPGEAEASEREPRESEKAAPRANPEASRQDSASDEQPGDQTSRPPHDRTRTLAQVAAEQSEGRGKQGSREAVNGRPADQESSQDQEQQVEESDRPSKDGHSGGEAEAPESTEIGGAGEKETGEEEAEPRYLPLEEVRDSIVEVLAEEKAHQEALRRLEVISAEVRRYVLEQYLPAREAYDRQGDTSRPFEPPPFPDLEPKAKELGIELGEIPELSILNVDELEDLKDAREVQGGEAVGLPFEELFVPRPGETGTGAADLLEVRTLRSPTGVYYAVWIRQRWEEETPPFEEIRAEVERAYRIEKARPLAKARAEELAEQLRKAAGDVQKVVAEQGGLEVISVGPMTLWYRRIGLLFDPGGIEPAEIPGIPYAGDEFRWVVLDLQPQQAGVAPDRPILHYYAIWLREKAPLEVQDFAREMILYLGLAHRMQQIQWARAMRRLLWRPGVIELLEPETTEVPPEVQARL